MGGRPRAEVRWYKDSWTGSDPSRPEWDRLVEDITKGLVETVVAWSNLYRLGKTCSELVKLFEYLSARSVNFISLKDHLDLSTVSGRRMAGVLGLDHPVRDRGEGEGILAGQEAALWRHPVGRVGEGSAGQGLARTGGEGQAPQGRGVEISHIARDGLEPPDDLQRPGCEGSPSTCEERESGTEQWGA